MVFMNIQHIIYVIQDILKSNVCLHYCKVNKNTYINNNKKQ
jgi:hypothetical protein